MSKLPYVLGGAALFGLGYLLYKNGQPVVTDPATVPPPQKFMRPIPVAVQQLAPLPAFPTGTKLVPATPPVPAPSVPTIVTYPGAT